MAKKKSYHFSLGDSSEGPVGFCARVEAESPEKAVEILNAAIEARSDEFELFHDLDGVDYITVYFNRAKVTVDDIDEENEIEEKDKEET